MVFAGNAEIDLAAPGERVHREVLEETSAEATRMSLPVEDPLFLARSDAAMPALGREYAPTVVAGAMGEVGQGPSVPSPGQGSPRSCGEGVPSDALDSPPRP